jgi:hypothetical protein
MNATGVTAMEVSPDHQPQRRQSARDGQCAFDTLPRIIRGNRYIREDP